MDAERISELFADQVLWGLDENEAAELHAGCQDLGLDEQALGLEATAASVVAALLPPEPMPASLHARLMASVRDEAPVDRAPERTRSPLLWAWIPLAAAVWFLGYLLGRPAAEPGPEQRCAQLLTLPETRQLSIVKTDDPLAGEASGELIWNGAKQEGYMRLRGLPVNDASELQYQLWIFDGGRSHKEPVDGGVFDIGHGETLVPIRASLDVRQARLFAITVEPPGGVVVSKQEHIVATSQ